MAGDLSDIFKNHKGKISDKWLSYINEWESIFSPLKTQRINLFEIGVHMGGSLEIWAKYFTHAKNIIGCDNDQSCRQLEFSDPRISIIIGDINSDNVENQLKDLAQELNIIIDDGSHNSGDIIRSFSRYFKYIQPGGFYIIEDLHTSYWENFNGGLNNPYSSLAFLKRLADIINFEHWRNNQSRKKFLTPYETYYGFNFEEIDLGSIHSVAFLNSLCVIHKKNPRENKLGRRIVVGSNDDKSEAYKKLNGTSIHDSTFDVKDDTHLEHFSLIKENSFLKKEIEVKEESLGKLINEVSEQNQTNQLLRSETEKQTEIIQQFQSDLYKFKNEINNREIQIDQYKSTLKNSETLIRQQNRRIQKLQDEIIKKKHSVNNLKENLTKNELLIEQKNADLEDRASFIEQLKEILVEREKEILSYVLDASWRLTRPLRKLLNFLKGGWPPKVTLKEIYKRRPSLRELYEYFLIKQSNLFEYDYYLKSFTDVRKSDIDPLMHFIKNGWKEKRNPSNTFSTEQYLLLYPEVEEAGTNPLIHYIKNNFPSDRSFSYYDADNHHFRYIDLITDESRVTAIAHNANNPPYYPDIIIFPIIDWDFRYQRPQQLACKLAEKGHRIFYVQTKIRHNSKNAPFIKPIMHNIFSVQISSADHYMDVFSLFADEGVDALEDSVRQLSDHFLINSAVIIVDSPVWRKLAVRLKKHFGWKLIYDCMDLHSGFLNSNASIELNEQKLIQASDIVFATSHYLYDRVMTEENKKHLIPNGVDFDFFHQASIEIPNEEMQDLSGPILGYYGAIADWFNTELIGELAIRNPEWTFVLIGSTYLADLKPLQGLSNILLLGEKPYSALPSYLSHFDVCLIPFKDLPLTQATNPVKLYEYLSAGKPVVATSLNELSYFKDHINLAKTVEDWETAIQESLNEPKSSKLHNSRFVFAKENSWESHAGLIEDRLLGLFPKISILMVSYNNLEYTKLCLESIENNTSYPNYEIIIVDNGSSKNTVTYLEDLQTKSDRVKVSLNQSNLGFARANNQAFELSSGDYLVFLNNDTIVTSGWMHRLFAHLQTTPKAGMVGPVTNSIGNEAKITITYEKLSEINRFSAQRAIKYSGRSFQINVLALFCCMIPREVFASVNGLDERYKIGMFEDDDLAMKIRQKGLKLFCAEDVFVHHFHGVSFRQLNVVDYQRIFAENKNKYERKWGVNWISHRYRESDLEKSSSQP